MSSSKKAEKSSVMEEAACVATTMEAVKILKQLTKSYLDSVSIVVSTILASTIEHNPNDLMVGVRQILKERGVPAPEAEKWTRPLDDIKPEHQESSKPAGQETQTIDPKTLKNTPIQMLFDFMKTTGAEEIRIIDTSKNPIR